MKLSELKDKLREELTYGGHKIEKGSVIDKVIILVVDRLHSQGLLNIDCKEGNNGN